MGTVYLASDPALGRDVAIKLLRDGFDDERSRKRFLREARAAGGLRHPNIVDIYDIGEDAGRPFIVMEYIPGETLAHVIGRRSPLPIGERLRLIEDLCDGLAYAHGVGVVHRDVKPANLIVDRNGALKILDFGIARQLSSGLTETGGVMGTLNYMAPEQLTGKPIDKRCDIFAAGLVSYELLAFQQAFPGDLGDGLLPRILTTQPRPLSEICPDLPSGVVGVVACMLEKDPRQRYQDLAEVSAAVELIRHRLPAERSGDTLLVPMSESSGRVLELGPGSEQSPTAKTVPLQSTDVQAGSPAKVPRRARPALMWSLASMVVVGIMAFAIAIFRVGLNHAPSAQAPEVRVSAVPPRTPDRQEASQPAARSGEINVHLTQAAQYARRHQYGPAIAEYDVVLALDPANKEALAGKAAAETESRSADGEIAKAERHVQLGQYLEAIAAYNAALALDPTNQRAVDGKRRAESLVKPSGSVRTLARPPANSATGSAWVSPIDGRTMVWIAAGTFDMGSPVEEFVRDADEDLHSVQISNGFWLDETEVTKEAYRKFILAVPDWQKGHTGDPNYLKDWDGANYRGDGERPVTFVDWPAAAAYAAWAGKRLPTEAEWEYAARAGTKSVFWWGDAFDQAKANNGREVWRVGSNSSRNPWNLCDMLGNVQEWTSSLYRPYPYRKDDGRESMTDLSHDRVVRGGAFNSKASYLRSANRIEMAPETADDRLGFRCALDGAK